MRFCILTVIALLFTVHAAPAKEPRAVHNRKPAGQMVVLGFAGDLGFSGNKQPLSTEGAIRHGDIIPWTELTSGIRGILAPDANFANLETVVSDRADLVADERRFTFQSSSAGLLHIVSSGINVLTVANNHSADFGVEGILETIRHLEETPGLKGFAGLGIGTKRYEPARFAIGDVAIAVGAIGIGVNPGGAAAPGQPLYRSDSELKRVTESLNTGPTDLRILSVHYGQELSSFPLLKDIARQQRVLDEDLADVIFGHHSHVPAGVGMQNGKPVFFGLGNFLHAGTQNLDRYGTCRDFGLFAKAFYWKLPNRKPQLQAIEMIPLRNTNKVTGVFQPQDAAARITVLNALNVSVVENPANAITFQTTATGSGLYCIPNIDIEDTGLKDRCGEPPAFPQPEMKVLEAFSASCRNSEPPPLEE